MARRFADWWASYSAKRESSLILRKHKINKVVLCSGVCFRLQLVEPQEVIELNGTTPSEHYRLVTKGLTAGVIPEGLTTCAVQCTIGTVLMKRDANHNETLLLFSDLVGTLFI